MSWGVSGWSKINFISGRNALREMDWRTSWKGGAVHLVHLLHSDSHWVLRNREFQERVVMCIAVKSSYYAIYK